MPHQNMQVSVGLILENECVLLGKRSTGYYNGYWEFPGGKIEKNETPYEALRRELSEELDINVTKASEMLTIKHSLYISTLTLYIYQVDDYEKDIKPNERQQLQWVKTSHMRQFKTIPTNEAILQYLEQLC